MQFFLLVLWAFVLMVDNHLHDTSGIANQRFAPITIDVTAVTVDSA